MALIREILALYTSRNIPRAAAALSYHLTMTFFPLIICLYALFGQSYATAMRLFYSIEHFLTADAAEMIKAFLIHVATSRGQAILIAAITILIASASAAVRVLQSTIGEMQGGHRFRAGIDILISFLLAAALLFAIYFSLLVVLSGRSVLKLIQENLSITILGGAWPWLRYLLLASIALGILWGVFALSRRRKDHYRVLPGAALSTLGIVAVSYVFSRLIGSSTRYSLVYGSLASLILMMFWLYMICQTIFIGAALNIALRNRARGRATPPAQKNTRKEGHP